VERTDWDRNRVSRRSAKRRAPACSSEIVGNLRTTTSYTEHDGRQPAPVTRTASAPKTPARWALISGTATIALGVVAPTKSDGNAGFRPRKSTWGWTAATGVITLYHVERQDPTDAALVGNRHDRDPRVRRQDRADRPDLQLSAFVVKTADFSPATTATVFRRPHPAAAPAAPATVLAAANTSSQVSLSWTATSGATSYIIQAPSQPADQPGRRFRSAYTTGGIVRRFDRQWRIRAIPTRLPAQNAAGASAFTQTQVTTPVAVIGTYQKRRH